MKRIGLFVCFLVGALYAASPVQAVPEASWRVEGSQNELWLVDSQQVTGYSQHHFTESFLITDPTIFAVPPDFRFRFDFTPIQGTDHNFVWNFQDFGNYYQAHFSGGAVWISRFINHQEMLSKGKNFSTALGETYAVELSQTGDQIVLTINGEQVNAFTDHTHDVNSQGSVGFKLSPGTVIPVESRFENILAHDVMISLLPIQPLRQNYPLWMDAEYDTAVVWSSQPTIGSLGCTLTSLVMIMRFHSLVTMPDGQPVNPLTVNEWLNSQPDGYVGQGLVNWFAAMRLVREISDRYSLPGAELPKLEFRYQGLPWRETAQAEILAGRPLIAQLPGHFTVVNGFDARSQGFFITDPFYDYQYLSQHASALSLRLFRPSQTDLSALVVVHKPQLGVTIENAVTQAVASQTWEENIVSAEGESSEAWRFTAVFQPTNGVYQLSMIGTANPEDVFIFAYDDEANVTILPLEEEWSDDEKLFLQFAKAGESAWTEEPAISGWDIFLQKLAELHTAHRLSQSQFDRLHSLAQFAAAAPADTWPRYKNYLTKIIEYYDSEIDAQARAELLLLLE